MLAKEGEGNDVTQTSHMLLAISLQSGISGHLRKIPLKKKRKTTFYFISFPLSLPFPVHSDCRIHPLLSRVAVPSLISGTKH